MRGDGSLVLRLYSVSDKTEEYEIVLPFGIKDAYKADLNETPAEALDFADRTVKGILGARSVETVILTLA